MANLTKQSREKLKNLLFKRMGKEFSDSEIEEAYENLMAFGFALMDLAENKNLESKPVFDSKLAQRGEYCV